MVSNEDLGQIIDELRQANDRGQWLGAHPEARLRLEAFLRDILVWKRAQRREARP